MKKSEFSNGFIDTYKGKRNVEAGWAIINKDTNETILSGHSLDRRCAEKTAKENLKHLRVDSSGVILNFSGYRQHFTIEAARKTLTALKEVGAEVTMPATRATVYNDAVKHNERIFAERRAKTEALCKIEIVEL